MEICRISYQILRRFTEISETETITRLSTSIHYSIHLSIHFSVLNATSCPTADLERGSRAPGEDFELAVLQQLADERRLGVRG